MSQRGTCWSITINNPVASDEESISLARQKSGWTVEGQLEQGTNGTPHYQLMLKTPQVRFSAVKKAFPRAHIELARNKEALAEYVKKEDTRVGALPASSELYPSSTKVLDMYGEWCQTYKKGIYVTQDAQGLLDLFDIFIREHIEKGYQICHIGVNPQIRSSIKLYGCSIIVRAIRRQTDRQDRQDNYVDPEINEDESDKETCETQSSCSEITSSTCS